MAMVELEDSDDVNIERCRTDSGTILSGKRLSGVHVIDCTVASTQPATEEASGLFRRCASWLLNHAVSVIVSLVVAGLVALLGWN